MKRRLTALVLALCLVLTLCPVRAEEVATATDLQSPAPPAEETAEPTVVPERVELSLSDGSVTLTDSTTYVLSGGFNAEADVTVAEGVTVKLQLRKATIRTLTLGAGSRVTLESTGICEVETLVLGALTELTWTGTGCVSVETVEPPEEARDSPFRTEPD